MHVSEGAPLRCLCRVAGVPQGGERSEGGSRRWEGMRMQVRTFRSRLHNKRFDLTCDARGRRPHSAALPASGMGALQGGGSPHPWSSRRGARPGSVGSRAARPQRVLRPRASTASGSRPIYLFVRDTPFKISKRARYWYAPQAPVSVIQLYSRSSSAPPICDGRRTEVSKTS